jgi:hypothetical protein
MFLLANFIRLSEYVDKSYFDVHPFTFYDQMDVGDPKSIRPEDINVSAWLRIAHFRFLMSP